MKAVVAPLDWGLGHATRCIPIIRILLASNWQVLLAGSGRSLTLLKQEFPNLETFDLPGYDPQYPANGSMVWKIFSQLPKFLSVIRAEHSQIEMIAKKNDVDVIISDN